MSTTLHSFTDIFDATFSDGQESVKLQKIIIPIIQRDYAQGRIDPDINRVRQRFLDSLLEAVERTPMTLDFVYGDIDSDGIMTPLDGQQRLTTLFLLHWYAAKKESVSVDQSAFLENFGYETRYSARNFCKDLTRFTPSFTIPISEEIVDQAWFPLEWKKDPTISSMLVMIDAIHDKFFSVDDLWGKLRGGAITFYFLPIKDMGLTDELYIKMNSRGKPLTRFEHFKAEMERSFRAIDETTAKRVISKIDLDWTDMLWQYRDSGNGTDDDAITDDEFLKYFRFICDIICYKGGESPQGKSPDEFDLLQTWFSGDKEKVLKNISIMESYFDCWCHIDGYESPAEFLESVMSHTHEDGKILIDTRNKIDIFEDCLHAYADKTGRTRLFPLNRIVLLYAVICYLCNQEKIERKEFERRLRVTNNLIQNSVDEVSDRTDRNRIPAILMQVDAIMLTGEIDVSLELNFNVSQLAEEKEKKQFIEVNQDQAAELYKLEDHPLLHGQIGIVGVAHIDYAGRFASLFDCSWDKIDCAMMAIGNYGQRERNKWRWQFASKGMQVAWDELFHRSANSGFENTSKILVELLEKAEEFSDDVLQEMVDNFTASCEEESVFPWRYYYVKYPVFRPGSFGKYSNSKADESPYTFSVLQTKSQWSMNTYMPFLKEADSDHLSRDSMGQRLVYGDIHVACVNGGYELRNNESGETIEVIPVPQNEEGLDTVDRIVFLKNYIAQKFSDGEDEMAGDLSDR